MDIRQTEDGMEIGKLIDDTNLPETAEDLVQLKERTLANEMYKGSVVSEDGSATIVLFTLYDSADIQAVAREVERKAKSVHSSGRIYFAGSPILITSIARLISADLKQFLAPVYLAKLVSPILEFSYFITKQKPIYTRQSLELLINSPKNISFEKANKELNYQARPLEQTLYDTFNWYIDNKILR